jgi:hypothetical protein
MPATDAIRRKALSILREGRCTVLIARSDDALRVHTAVVRVQGNRGVYVVDLKNGGWTCTCDRSMAGVRCGHIVAAQLITGHGANGAAA